MVDAVADCLEVVQDEITSGVHADAAPEVAPILLYLLSGEAASGANRVDRQIVRRCAEKTRLGSAANEKVVPGGRCADLHHRIDHGLEGRLDVGNRRLSPATQKVEAQPTAFNDVIDHAVPWRDWASLVDRALKSSRSVA